jgi:hypothetical protein
MAGSWCEIFPYSITWNVVFHKHDKTAVSGGTGLVREEAIEAAPSWSWFSVPIFQRHHFSFEATQSLRRILEYSDKNRIEPMFVASLSSFDRILTGKHAKGAEAAAFHDFTNIGLTIYMKTCSAYLEYSLDRISKEDHIAKQFERHVDTKYGTFSYSLDRPDKPDRPSGPVTLGLLLELRIGHETELSRNYGGRVLIGLVMTLEPDGETHKRIGLWTLELSPDPRW